MNDVSDATTTGSADGYTSAMGTAKAATPLTTISAETLLGGPATKSAHSKPKNGKYKSVFEQHKGYLSKRSFDIDGDGTLYSMGARIPEREEGQTLTDYILPKDGVPSRDKDAIEGMNIMYGKRKVPSERKMNKVLAKYADGVDAKTFERAYRPREKKVNSPVAKPRSKKASNVEHYVAPGAGATKGNEDFDNIDKLLMDGETILRGGTGPTIQRVRDTGIIPKTDDERNQLFDAVKNLHLYGDFNGFMTYFDAISGEAIDTLQTARKEIITPKYDSTIITEGASRGNALLAATNYKPRERGAQVEPSESRVRTASVYADPVAKWRSGSGLAASKVTYTDKTLKEYVFGKTLSAYEINTLVGAKFKEINAAVRDTKKRSVKPKRGAKAVNETKAREPRKYSTAIPVENWESRWGLANGSVYSDLAIKQYVFGKEMSSYQINKVLGTSFKEINEQVRATKKSSQDSKTETKAKTTPVKGKLLWFGPGVSFDEIKSLIGYGTAGTYEPDFSDWKDSRGK